MLADDRGRACSFGADAERYERARPGYPSELIDDLTASGPGEVLDVGSGTGKVSRLFVRRGCRVLGVEPDAAMAAVAERQGLTVEVSPFEAWQPRGRMFDLVVCGQAWHWIEAEIAARKVADVLRQGGRFAAFWNLTYQAPNVRSVFDQVYAKAAPSLADGSVPGGTAASLGASASKDLSPDMTHLRATGLFENISTASYRWHRTYLTDEWLDLLQTHSDHATLPEAELATLVQEMGRAIDKLLEGSIAVDYATVVLTANRRRQRPRRHS